MTKAEACRMGGIARARKYSHEQLSVWSKKGGRPRFEIKEKRRMALSELNSLSLGDLKVLWATK